MEIAIIILMTVLIVSQIYMIKSIKEQPKREEPKIVEKPKAEKLTKEQKKRQEELKKAFENLMNYDYNEALKKKE